MNICIGGDLDGVVVTNREGTYFEASEIDATKQSSYNRQSYIVEGNTYRFWLCAQMPFAETTVMANKHLAKKYLYLS
ncbi:hypothetical protein [Acinetobacter courvalinii]|uniref:hypothetical protein n=1 Tax=Acinetobacter courvalinii TaxID=280147 RepID=UPI0019003827|nr:hypothetical protein [Acinetobacter courvalinii]MBJ9958386.1 hypothetical protein [Acinetobacter courvalinii]